MNTNWCPSNVVGKTTQICGSLRFTLATAAVASLTAVLYGFNIDPHSANVSMLYLLVVALSALMLGRTPAIWASILSFLLFDWFFVKPQHTFLVAEPGEWVALCVFLLTATIIGQLMASLQARASEAQQHQRETAALAEASWAVASQLDTRSALLEVLKQVSMVVNLQVAAILAKDSNDKPPSLVARHPQTTEGQITEGQILDQLNYSLSVVRTTTPPAENDSEVIILPITMPGVDFGYVFLKLGAKTNLTDQQRQVVESLVSHSAVILHRDRWVKKEAEATALAHADRLKTALLSMVSHDFRSPLTSIKASVSTLLQDGTPLAPDTMRGLYQGIEQEADRLNRMVGNILDLSRIEAKAWRLRREQTPVGEVIGMALDAFDEQNNKRITVTLDSQLPEIYADSTQIVQVLKNLVENALKYSSESATIEICTKLVDGAAVIEVLDRGTGLPEDSADIFKPFWRAPHLHESSTPGVGIGLAVCRGLVEAHGGMIEACPRDGGGSIFRITLPPENNVVEASSVTNSSN